MKGGEQEVLFRGPVRHCQLFGLGPAPKGRTGKAGRQREALGRARRREVLGSGRAGPGSGAGPPAGAGRGGGAGRLISSSEPDWGDSGGPSASASEIFPALTQLAAGNCSCGCGPPRGSSSGRGRARSPQRPPRESGFQAAACAAFGPLPSAGSRAWALARRAGPALPAFGS